MPTLKNGFQIPNLATPQKTYVKFFFIFFYFIVLLPKLYQEL